MKYFVHNFINFKISELKKNFFVTRFCENKIEVTCATKVFCGLTFGLGEKLTGSNTGMLRNWEVFFNHNKMVSDTSGRSQTKIFV